MKLKMYKKITSLIMASLMLFSALCFGGCGSQTTINEVTGAAGISLEETSAPLETVPPTTAAPVEINIMMIGDMLIHEGVYGSGLMADGTYNFDHLFTNVADDIKACDIKILNQETILGGTELGLSAYPCFNSPQELGDTEVQYGFNVICSASNHSLDKGLNGLNRCIEYWKTSHPEVAVLGINQTEEEYNNIYVYEKNDFKVAILNYTYGTNGIPIPSSNPYAVNLLDTEKITQDVTKAKAIADMVVVCPHWGTENYLKVSTAQKEWTDLFLKLGVDVVIGTHPHVIEPVEVLTGEDGHQMLVFYSLGNFVSNQDMKEEMIGGLANVTLVKDGSNCYIKEYTMTPVVTHLLYGRSKITTYKLKDYTESLASSSAIRRCSGCSDFSLSYCISLCSSVLGEKFNTDTCTLHEVLKQ